MEFRSCARGRQWCGIIYYYWWTASIKPRLLFSRAGYASWGLSLSSAYYEILTHTFRPPKPTDTFVELTTVVATSTNSVGANLKMVPNQPIVFKVRFGRHSQDGPQPTHCVQGRIWVSQSSNTFVLIYEENIESESYHLGGWLKGICLILSLITIM